MQQLAASLAPPQLNATPAGCPDLGGAEPSGSDRLPLLLLYGAVLLVGLPANLLTALLTWRQARRHKNVLAVYLCGLALVDLGYLATLPLWVDYVVRGRRWRWSPAACRLAAFVFFTNMYVSVFLLCAVSCDRYVAVRYGLEGRGLRRQRVARRVLLAVVAAVALGHAPVFAMPEAEAAAGPHQRCFEPGGAADGPLVAALDLTRVAVGFLAPLAVLVGANHGLLAGVRRSATLRRSQKDRVRRLAVAVVALFLLCFGPYHLVLLARGLAFHLAPAPAATCLLDGLLYTPYSVSLALATVNAAVNPVLYVLSSSHVRRELRGVLAGACGRARCRPGTSSGTGSHDRRHNQSHSRSQNQNQSQLQIQSQIQDKKLEQNQNQDQVQNQIQTLSQDQNQNHIQNQIKNQEQKQDQIQMLNQI